MAERQRQAWSSDPTCGLPYWWSRFSEEAGGWLCCPKIIGGMWPLSLCLGDLEGEPNWAVWTWASEQDGGSEETDPERRIGSREGLAPGAAPRVSVQSAGRSVCRHPNQGTTFPDLCLSARGSDFEKNSCAGLCTGLLDAHLLEGEGAGQGVLSEVPSDRIHVSKRKSGHCSWRKGEEAEAPALGVGSLKASEPLAVGWAFLLREAHVPF